MDDGRCIVANGWWVMDDDDDDDDEYCNDDVACYVWTVMTTMMIMVNTIIFDAG